MTAYRLPAGALLLAGDDLDAIRDAVALAQWARRRDGLAPSARLAALAALVTDSGHADSPDDPAADDGPMSYLSSDEAAAALGVSPRTARRLAPELGGRKVGGTWLLDAAAVDEHHRGGTTA